MKIYIIRKPNTNEVYIGQTELTLKKRLQNHFKHQKLESQREVYQWLDKTCIIELIEEFEANTKDSVKEMTYIQEYLNNGYQVKNTKVGNQILDPKGYIKSKTEIRTQEYHKWTCNIWYKAKKEGLSSKEYRLKYSIPDYTGPKHIII